jgi:methionyl-tRNA synthetase
MAGEELLCGQIDPTSGVTMLCDSCREIARIEAMYNAEDRCAHCGTAQRTGECAACGLRYCAACFEHHECNTTRVAVYKLHRQGLTIEQIARQTKRTRERVRQVLKASGGDSG